MRIEQMVKKARQNSPHFSKLKKVIEKGKFSKWEGYEFGVIEKSKKRYYVVRLISVNPLSSDAHYVGEGDGRTKEFTDFIDATDHLESLRHEYANEN